MNLKTARKGFVGLVILFLLVGGLVGIYFGYEWYNQRNFIKLHDGSMIRLLDIPPFAERVTSADKELIGECVLSIGASEEQASQFFNSMSNRMGYLFAASEQGFTIEVRRNYIVKGEFANNKLNLTWEPVLPSGLKKKALAIAPAKTENK